MGDLTRGAQGPINVVPLRTWDKAYLKELWTNWYLSSQTRGPFEGCERERERESANVKAVGPSKQVWFDILLVVWLTAAYNPFNYK
jgi:hypothetical protein